MKKRAKYIVYAILLFTLFLTVFSACRKSPEEWSDAAIKNLSFRDVHGVTQSEISAIEALQKKYDSFSCAVNLSTDVFYDRNGELSGYVILFYDWLSGFFGIPFKPTFYEWGNLANMIGSGEVDFTIDLAETPERREAWFLTSPVAQRLFKIYRLDSGEPLADIINSRKPRYAFMAGSVLLADLIENIDYDFETVFVKTHIDAYPLLKNGEIDAYIAMDNIESIFDAYGDMVVDSFFPLIFKSFCLLTANAEFKPVISVLEKAMDTRTCTYLAGLRKAGYEKYLGNKLYAQLTEEERLYIKNNPVVPFAAEFNNYPISFFDTHTKQWHGIYFDTLDEIANMTGLKFECVNGSNVLLPELISKLENGEALILSELYRLKEYEDRFLWSKISLFNDNYAFISKLDFRNIEVDEVSHIKVGIRKNTHYAELFKKMFPDHGIFTEYDTIEDIWQALKQDDIDVIFASRRRLMTYTNYGEEAGFKLNLVFDYEFDTSFGFNKNADVLRSIVDKSVRFVNINNILNQWMNRTYDYRVKLAEAQRPWLISASVLTIFVLALVSILWRRSRSTSKHLEEMVKRRTDALAFETAKLRAMIDSVPDTMFCKDLNFKYTQCNKPFEQFMGCTEKELLNNADTDGTWLPAEQVERIHNIEQTVVNENKRLIFEETVNSPVDGKEFIFETIKAPIRQDGVVVGLVAIIHDITWRKKLENDLAFQTAMLKTMLGCLPDAVFCKGLDFKFTLCNNYMMYMLGKKENDIIGKYDEDALGFLPEAAAVSHDADLKVLNEHQLVVVEEQIPCADGVLRLFETVKSPLVMDGKVIGVMAIGRDITNRKEMEDELAYQTSLLRTIVGSLPEVVFCKDINLKYTLCNNYMAGLFNRQIKDMIGNDDVDALGIPAELAEKTYGISMKVIKENQRTKFEDWIPCADGIKRLFETIVSPLVMDEKVIGVVGVGHDITQRKSMEDDLAFKTSKMQMIINSIPDILFCKDAQLKYTQCNRNFEEFWGVPEEAMLDLTDQDGMWLSPEIIKKMNYTESSVIKEEKIVTSEMSLHAPLTGKEGVFETILAPLKQNDAVVGLLGIARDITLRKAMEEAVQAASRAKSAFLANMSHELRTPLNVVIGLTDLVLEDDRLDAYVTNNLVKIGSAGSTLLNIVNDILDFSKIESGKLELTPVEYSTPSLLNDIITLVITRLGEKPITFRLDIDNDLPANLYGDDLRVKQILTNLLTNAVKYTRQGSIELKVRCTREADTVWMDIAVSDTGIGIHKEDIDKLFSDYNQVDTKANRAIEGTGLGLAITKKLAELMNGKISVKSEYGKGSTFSLRLKQGFIKDTPIGANVADKLRTFCYADDKSVATMKLVRLNLNYAKVLVVDDMQTNLDVAMGLLHKYKMQVDCLDNGHDAIERIRAGTPAYNAIFMDHMMPGMDGIEAVDAIRALGTEYAQKIPIIALTANAIQGTEQMFYEHSFQGFISKPINITELDSIVRKWVRDDTREDVLVSDTSGPPGIPSTPGVPSENIKIEIPGIDVKKGLSLYAGDTKVYLPLLRSYTVNTPKVLDKLRNVSEQTLPAYVITVHGLKGTSANIGAETIREAAFDLETKSRAGDLQGVLAKNEKLIADAEIILANVKAWLDQYDANSEKKPRLKAPDKELLARLRQSCESYDIEGIDKAMSELESADYEEGAELVAWIRQKIDISKMGEVAQRLAGE